MEKSVTKRQIVTEVEETSYIFKIDDYNGIRVKDGKITSVWTGDWRAGGSWDSNDEGFERNAKFIVKRIALENPSDLNNLYKCLSPGEIKDFCKCIKDFSWCLHKWTKKEMLLLVGVTSLLDERWFLNLTNF